MKKIRSYVPLANDSHLAIPRTAEFLLPDRLFEAFSPTGLPSCPLSLQGIVLALLRLKRWPPQLLTSHHPSTTPCIPSPHTSRAIPRLWRHPSVDAIASQPVGIWPSTVSDAA